MQNSPENMNASSVFQRLIKPNYWTGYPQSEYYYLDQRQRKQGPAKTPCHPGQFNLYSHLAGLGAPSQCSQATYLAALPHWTLAAQLAQLEVDGCPVADTALVLSPKLMGPWLQKMHRKKSVDPILLATFLAQN